MPDYTEPYNLLKLSQGESLATDGYKFTDADRDTIARLLFLGAEGHRHTGGSAEPASIAEAPLLAVATTGGALPPGSRLYYKTTLVDAQGFESTPSEEARIDTAPSIVAPFAPVNPNVDSTGGSLPPGNYYYLLSAYTDVSNSETVAENAIYVSVPFSTQTNRVSFDLPALPGGATGFNVYRRTPSGPGYLHIATLNAGVESTQFVDNGTLVEDCDRFAPTVSTARSANSVVVSYPGTIPAGSAWRIYRSNRTGDYVNSLLTTIIDGSTSFTDTGAATLVGQPPTVGLAPGAPAKIDLEDGAEAQGRLPLAMVSAFPYSETFALPGPVVAVEGTTTWVCPFPQATIVGVRASLGRGSVASIDLYADVEHAPQGTDTWDSVFAGEELFVPSGASVGESVAPTGVAELVEGDRLTVNVLQDGDPATDQDMTVTIYLHVYGWTSLVSHPWAE